MRHVNLVAVLMLVTGLGAIVSSAAAQGIPKPAVTPEQGRITALEAELARMVEERARLEDAMVTVRAEMDQVRASAEARRAVLRDTETQLIAMETRLAQLDSMKQELGLRREIQELESRHAAMREKFHESYPPLVSLRRDLARQRTRLAEVEARRRLGDEVGAFIQSIVEGKPHRAEASIREALRVAAPKDRPRLLVQHVLILQRTGRPSEARGALRELLTAGVPYAEWAQRTIDRLDAVAAEANTGDQLQALIRRLDGPWDERDVHTAYTALDKLGALAVPALLAALDTLGPFGQRHALQLLARHADDRVIDAIAKRLTSEDPTLQVMGAEVLHMLPASARRSLLPTLGALEHPVAIAHAARARARDADGVDDALRWLDTATAAGRPELDRQILHILAERKSLWGHPGASAIAARIAARGVEDAIETWSSVSRPLDGEAALALLRSLPAPDLRHRLFQTVRHDLGRNEAAFFIGALGTDLGADTIRDCVALIRSRGLRGAGKELTPLLDSPSPVLRREVLDYLAKSPDPIPVERVEGLLFDQPEAVRVAAFGCLASRAPARLNRHARALLQRTPKLWHSVLEHLARHADAQGARAAIRAAMADDSLDRSEVHTIVGQRTTGENLLDVLDYVDPHKSQSRSWSSRPPAVRRAFERWFTAHHTAAAIGRIADVDAAVAADIANLVAAHAGSEDVPEITRALRNGTLPPEVVGSLVETMARLGGASTLPVLRDYLVHDDTTIRAGAWRGLRSMAPGERTHDLMRLISSKDAPKIMTHLLEDPIVRTHPEISALARTRIAGWTEPRVELRGFLNAIDEKHLVELGEKLLLRSADRPAPNDRLVLDVMTALRRVEGEPLLAAHAAALRHPAAMVRRQAAFHLGRSCSKDAVAPLMDALRDEDEDVVRNVEAALERIRQYHDARRRWETWLKTGKMPPDGKKVLNESTGSKVSRAIDRKKK